MAELPSDRANCAPLAKVRRKFPRSRDRNHGLWKLQSDATRDTSTTSEIVIFFFSFSLRELQIAARCKRSNVRSDSRRCLFFKCH